MTGPYPDESWFMRFRNRMVLGVLALATRLLRPVQGPSLALIRFCKRRDLLFLNDWRTDVEPLAIAQRGSEAFVVDLADMTIGATVRRTGGFDFEKFEATLALLPAGFVLETVYDIGANIGVICIPAVKRGLARRAVAFEPEPNNYRLLVANIYINGVQDRIEHHNTALGSRDGEVLCFELAETNHGDHRVRVSSSEGAFREGARRSINVPSMRLDSFAAGIDAANSLVWMDVQGYEGHVLAGAQQVIRTGAYLVTEVWPYGMKRANCLDSFKAAVASYSHFYDLSESNPVAIPINRIDELMSRLGDTGANTDILLC